MTGAVEAGSSEWREWQRASVMALVRRPSARVVKQTDGRGANICGRAVVCDGGNF
jgi:hypothetical protein